MAKTKTVFYCTACGNETPKWQGKCPSCGEWNTLIEHVEKPAAVGRAKSAPVGISRTPQRLLEVHSDLETRFSTGIGELDRVLGGGAVTGSLVLVGGAPGIGKSTLLLQICNRLCDERKVLYISGEESEKQLKMGIKMGLKREFQPQSDAGCGIRTHMPDGKRFSSFFGHFPNCP